MHEQHPYSRHSMHTRTNDCNLIVLRNTAENILSTGRISKRGCHQQDLFRLEYVRPVKDSGMRTKDSALVHFGTVRLRTRRNEMLRSYAYGIMLYKGI